MSIQVTYFSTTVQSVSDAAFLVRNACERADSLPCASFMALLSLSLDCADGIGLC